MLGMVGKVARESQLTRSAGAAGTYFGSVP